MTNFLSTSVSRRPFAAFAILIAFACAAIARTAPGRYTLILEDPPAVRQFRNARSPEAASYSRQVQAKHRALEAELRSRKVPVIGSVSTVLNAMFVVATPDRVNELKSLP